MNNTTRQVNRCACGKRMSRYSNKCNTCHKARMAELTALARAQVATGKCPHGHALKRNLSLTGWWQCEQNGAVGFRARSNEPACNFQTFTE